MSIMQPSDRASMNRERIRLGISACLLGERVRFDGGHKRDPFLVEIARTVRRLGAGVPGSRVRAWTAPRESMRLVQAGAEIRLLTNKTAQDQTARMRGYARRRLEELADAELCRLRVEEGLAHLRPRARQGVRHGRDAREIGTRAVCRRPGDALSPAAGRRGRAAQRSAAARELRRAHLCVSTTRRVCLPRAGRWGTSCGSTPLTSSR